MSFTVLSDSDVKNILASVTASEVSALVRSLERGLTQYSCDNELQYQPDRSVISRPDGQISIFMPATAPQVLGVKIVGISPDKSPAEVPTGQIPPPGLTSVLTLCDAQGRAIGTLNAAALTAFRTSLGSMLLYRFRRNTGNIVVFGAGKQALWHIKLAVLLRGQDIRSITIVNRSSQRTQQLIDTLTKEPESPWPSHISLNVFDEQGDRDSALEALLVESDVIFCTTPSTQPLFPAAFLTSPKALAKTRYIAAIGSYRLDMQEIDPSFLKLVVDPTSSLAKTVHQGIIVVDTREGCLHEAGELVKAEVPVEKMVEVGQVIQDKNTTAAPEVTEWLESGLVIYKSVGVGVMDLAIGQHLLELARERNIGLVVADF